MRDMKRWVEDFFSEFHRHHLKPLGFKKVRHTFSRDLGDYVERFNFQGSAWNSSDEKDPWLFYINVGVEFRDLPPRTPCLDFPKTHWWQRIEHIALNASDSYNLHFPIDSELAASELLPHIKSASENLSRHIPRVLNSYLENDGMFELGLHPVVGDVEDASVNHDAYL